MRCPRQYCKKEKTLIGYLRSIKLSAVGTYRRGMRLQALKLAMFCAIATHISAKYETRATGGRVANPNPNRVSADEAKIREKRSLLSRGRKAVKKNATFKLSDIEKRLRDVEERYVLLSSLKNPDSIAQETAIKNPKVTRIKIFLLQHILPFLFTVCKKTKCSNFLSCDIRKGNYKKRIDL